MPIPLPVLKPKGSFSPKSISGLQLWLKADAGLYQDSACTVPAVADADPVGGWKDQSGNAKDATQSTDGNRPTLKLNIRNGRSIVRFDGSASHMDFSSTVLTNFTVYIAHRTADMASGANYILGRNGTSGIYCGGNAVVGYGASDGTNSIRSKVEPTTFGIAVFQNGDLFRNGIEFEYDSELTITGMTISELGVRSSVPLYFKGDIGELLIYNTVHDTSTRRKIEKYLGIRWGVKCQGMSYSLPASGPGLFLAWDDGRLGTREAYLYMKARGLKATCYVISDYVGTANKLTSAHLVAMDADGWVIANHSKDHPYLTSLTEAQQEAEMTDCETALTGWGLSAGNKHFAYPYGNYDATTLTAMSHTSMLTGRQASVSGNFDPSTAVHYEMGLTFEATNTTTLSQLQDAVSAAVAAGKYCLLLCHSAEYISPGAGELSMDVFEQFIDWIVAQNIPCLTVADIYALM